jgi:hypothetical protein
MNQAENITMSDGIPCYTDVSYYDNRSGAGGFSDTLNLKESYSIGTYTTVFQADVCAICQKVMRQFTYSRTVKLP